MADRTADNGNFTAEERAAMKDRAKETRAARSRTKKSPEEVYAEGLAEIETKIAELPDADRTIVEQLHALVLEHAPHLVPRTYYGMPAWAKDGKVLCFFQPASKFKVRYATFGFETPANLDDGRIWPTSYAVTELGPEEREFFAALVRRAAS
ncbi:DUF1801 domain-containing protein [Microbacterium sp.]|uniref:iron chaperone n=1 Tax=Microbacterium sp. TaxID=51671 RepID=UPI00333E691D